MTREDVLQVLRDHEAELRERGVIPAALFGSLARGEAGPKSDIDVAIRFAPDASITLWSYAGLKRRVSSLLLTVIPAAAKRRAGTQVRLG